MKFCSPHFKKRDGKTGEKTEESQIVLEGREMCFCRRHL